MHQRIQHFLKGLAHEIRAQKPNVSPTEAQKESGNYRKAHIQVHGIDIAIENPAGSTRSGTDSSGKQWESKVFHHYGFFKRSEGADGDEIDCFIGPEEESQQVFIVNQCNPETGEFDEHKVMLGFRDEAAARAGYLANYEPGWTGLGSIHSIGVGGLKEWIKSGDTSTEFLGMIRKSSVIAEFIKSRSHKYIRKVPAMGGGFHYYYSQTHYDHDHRSTLDRSGHTSHNPAHNVDARPTTIIQLPHEKEWDARGPYVNGKAAMALSQRFIGKTVKNRDTGWGIKVSKASIKHTIQTSGPRGFQVLGVLDKLINHSIHTRDMKDESGREMRWHSLVGAVKIGSEMFRVRLTVRDLPEGPAFYHHELSGIEIVPGWLPATGQKPPPQPGTIRIGDLWPQVNHEKQKSSTEIGMNHSEKIMEFLKAKKAEVGEIHHWATGQYQKGVHGWSKIKDSIKGHMEKLHTERHTRNLEGKVMDLSFRLRQRRAALEEIKDNPEAIRKHYSGTEGLSDNELKARVATRLDETRDALGKLAAKYNGADEPYLTSPAAEKSRKKVEEYKNSVQRFLVDSYAQHLDSKFGARIASLAKRESEIEQEMESISLTTAEGAYKEGWKEKKAFVDKRAEIAAEYPFNPDEADEYDGSDPASYEDYLDTMTEDALTEKYDSLDEDLMGVIEKRSGIEERMSEAKEDFISELEDKLGEIDSEASDNTEVALEDYHGLVESIVEKHPGMNPHDLINGFGSIKEFKKLNSEQFSTRRELLKRIQDRKARKNKSTIHDFLSMDDEAEVSIESQADAIAEFLKARKGQQVSGAKYYKRVATGNVKRPWKYYYSKQAYEKDHPLTEKTDGDNARSAAVDAPRSGLESVGLSVRPYKEKSFLITGKTKENLEALRSAKARFGTGMYLSGANGWVFPERLRAQVMGHIEGLLRAENADSDALQAVAAIKSAIPEGTMVEIDKPKDALQRVGGYGLHIREHRGGDGRFSFVGSVPDKLGYVDGATEEQIQAGKRFGGRFGPKTRSFETRSEAIAFANANGFHVEGQDAVTIDAIKPLDNGGMEYKVKDSAGKTVTITDPSRMNVVPQQDDAKVSDRIQTATPETRVQVQNDLFGGRPKSEEQRTESPTIPDYKPDILPPLRLADHDGQNEFLDYTKVVPMHISLSNERTVLSAPRPSFVPEIDEDEFARSGYRLEAAKTGPDEYVIPRGMWQSGTRMQRDPVTKQMNQVEADTRFYKVSRDVLAATQDYYMKRAKARLKSSIDERRARAKDAGIDPKRVKGTRLKVISERRMTYKHQAFLSAVFPFGPPGSSGWVGRYDAIQGKAKGDKVSYFDHLHQVSSDIGIRINDIGIQTTESQDTYTVGQKTSYGDSNLNDALVESHGFQVKRQNGDTITPPEVQEIREAFEHVWNAYGDKSEMARSWGLKVSHAGGKMMHARKAVGIFFPRFKAIGVTNPGDTKAMGFTLGHEYAHFMDHYLGGKSGRHYASDDPAHIAGKIASEFRSSMVAAKGSDYWNRTCECFARACEQYVAVKSGDEQTYDGAKFYMRNTLFKEKIAPMIEQFLSENKEALKSAAADILVIDRGGNSRIINEFLKSKGEMKAGHKYYRREQTAQGYKYYYTEADYKREHGGDSPKDKSGSPADAAAAGAQAGFKAGAVPAEAAKDLREGKIPEAKGGWKLQHGDRSNGVATVDAGRRGKLQGEFKNGAVIPGNTYVLRTPDGNKLSYAANDDGVLFRKGGEKDSDSLVGKPHEDPLGMAGRDDDDDTDHPALQSVEGKDARTNREFFKKTIESLEKQIKEPPEFKDENGDDEEHVLASLLKEGKPDSVYGKKENGKLAGPAVIQFGGDKGRICAIFDAGKLASDIVVVKPTDAGKMLLSRFAPQKQEDKIVWVKSEEDKSVEENYVKPATEESHQQLFDHIVKHIGGFEKIGSDGTIDEQKASWQEDLQNRLDKARSAHAAWSKKADELKGSHRKEFAGAGMHKSRILDFLARTASNASDRITEFLKGKRAAVGEVRHWASGPHRKEAKGWTKVRESGPRAVSEDEDGHAGKSAKPMPNASFESIQKRQQEINGSDLDPVGKATAMADLDRQTSEFVVGDAPSEGEHLALDKSSQEHAVQIHKDAATQSKIQSVALGDISAEATGQIRKTFNEDQLRELAEDQGKGEAQKRAEKELGDKHPDQLVGKLNKFLEDQKQRLYKFINNQGDLSAIGVIAAGQAQKTLDELSRIRGEIDRIEGKIRHHHARITEAETPGLFIKSSVELEIVESIEDLHAQAHRAVIGFFAGIDQA